MTIKNQSIFNSGDIDTFTQNMFSEILTLNTKRVFIFSRDVRYYDRSNYVMRDIDTDEKMTKLDY